MKAKNNMVIVKYVGDREEITYLKWFDKLDWNEYLKQIKLDENEIFPFTSFVDDGILGNIKFQDYEDFIDNFDVFKADCDNVKLLQLISDGDEYIGNHIELPEA